MRDLRRFASGLLRWAAACGLLALLPPLGAEEAPPAAGNETSQAQFERELAAIQALSRPRDIFEFDFTPLAFDRVLLQDDLGVEHVYYFLAFRLRNRVADTDDVLAEKYSRYNEVLDSIVDQYEAVQKEVAAGARLRMRDTSALRDPSVGVIVKRDALQVKPRRLSITSLVLDEHGTRFHALDPIPYSHDPDAFDFEDRGETEVNIPYQRVHDEVEETLGMRLFNTVEIRRLEIPPYDPERPSTFTNPDGELDQRDGFGMHQGEVKGVIIYPRLNPQGNHFTVRVQGLANNLRFEIPEKLPPLEVEDHFNIRIRRRTYVLEYSRLGDEYYRGRDRLTLERHGYRWLPSFQRLHRRRTFALSRYFLNNIRMREETTREKKVTYPVWEGTAELDVKVPWFLNEQVLKEQLEHYRSVQEGFPERYDEKRAAIDARLEAIEKRYGDTDDVYATAQLETWRELLKTEKELLTETEESTDWSLDQTIENEWLIEPNRYESEEGE